MVKTLFLQMEVAGCMTTCMHCWAQGHPYPHMPLEDITHILDGAERFCAESGIAFDCYPMHEVAAHPQAGELLKRFVRHTSFEPLATTGVPLATREDWRDVLETARATCDAPRPPPLRCRGLRRCVARLALPIGLPSTSRNDKPWV